MAALATRTRKMPQPRERLFERWRALGRVHQWSEPEVERLLRTTYPRRCFPTELAGARADALKQLTDQDSHFAERDLVRSLAEACQGRGLGAQDILALDLSLHRSGSVLPVGCRRGETRFSTPDMLALERKLFELADHIRKAERFDPPVAMPLKEGVQGGLSLSDEQMAVITHLTRSTGGLHLVAGMAGTGKTVNGGCRKGWRFMGRAFRPRQPPSLRKAVGLPPRPFTAFCGGFNMEPSPWVRGRWLWWTRRRWWGHDNSMTCFW
jgi:hypothetical protein